MRTFPKSYANVCKAGPEFRQWIAGLAGTIQRPAAVPPDAWPGLKAGTLNAIPLAWLYAIGVELDRANRARSTLGGFLNRISATMQAEQQQQEDDSYAAYLTSLHDPRD